jgi:S-adenosylmethionine:tRNA-ribosyltransferase-isomerase (queuine synthetase)
MLLLTNLGTIGSARAIDMLLTNFHLPRSTF